MRDSWLSNIWLHGLQDQHHEARRKRAPTAYVRTSTPAPDHACAEGAALVHANNILNAAISMHSTLCTQVVFEYYLNT